MAGYVIKTVSSEDGSTPVYFVDGKTNMISRRLVLIWSADISKARVFDDYELASYIGDMLVDMNPTDNAVFLVPI